MTTNELIRLQRYRRVAEYHRLDPAPDGMLPADEIDLLQAHLNAKLYHDAEPWMLPSWAVLSLKDFDKDRHPSSELRNNMYGNWSLIGGAGAKQYGFADSRGLVTARIENGSIDFWLQSDKDVIIPALIGKDGPQLRLVSTDDQIYEWKTYLKSIEFDRLLYHVTQDDMEYIFNEVNLRNHGLEKAKFTFYVLVRPMSVHGVEPIEFIEFNQAERCLYVNGSVALAFDSSPSSVHFYEAADCELIENIKQMTDFHSNHIASSAGQAVAALRFDIILAPAGFQRVFFWSPLASIEKVSSLNLGKPTTECRDNSVGEWFDFSDNRVAVTFPDERLDSGFSQASVSLALQAFSVMFPEIPYPATLDWRERMRVLLALLRSGCMPVAKKIVDALVENLNVPDGPLDLSIYGPLLWGIHQYFEYTQGMTLDEDRLRFLARLTTGVVEAAETQIGSMEIGSENETTDSNDGLLQHHLVIREGVIADLERKMWTIAALESSLATVTPLHGEVLIQRLNDSIESYRKQIVEICDEIERARWLRPTDSGSEHVDLEILSLLASYAHLRNNAIDVSFLLQLKNKISSKRIVNNLWKLPHTAEKYSSHLLLRLAHFYLITGLRDEVELILGRALEFMSDDYHLPEFVNTHTFGGAGGSGSSIAASADLILLLCDMLVREKDSNLIILSGVPEEWFIAKKPLIIEQLPLRSGPAYVEIGMSANQHQIEVGMDSFPEEIEIHVPPSIPMSLIKVYGGSIVERGPKVKSPFIKIVPLSDAVILTYRR